MNEPFVFLHGFAGGPESFAEVTPRADSPYLAPYLSGHGDAPPGEWAESFEAEITRLGGRLREACERPTHLVGYSLGARVALGLVVRRPELFSRVTLIGVNPGLGSERKRRERRNQDRRFVELLEGEGVERFVDEWETQPVFASQKRLPAPVLARQRSLRSRHSAAGLAHAMRSLGLAEMPDFSPFLPAIDRPVTLVVGAEDQKFQTLAREMDALLPHSRVIVAPGCGHNVVLEAPDLMRRVLGTRSEFS